MSSIGKVLVNWLVSPVVGIKRKALSGCCSSGTAASPGAENGSTFVGQSSIPPSSPAASLDGVTIAGAFLGGCGSPWTRRHQWQDRHTKTVTPKSPRPQTHQETRTLLIPRGLEPRTFGLSLLFCLSRVALLDLRKVPDCDFTFCLAQESGRRPAMITYTHSFQRLRLLDKNPA